MSTNINNIAVIGMGTMGHGIAQVAAMAGYQTLVYDTEIEGLEKGLQAIAGNIQKGLEKGKVDEATAQQALGRLEAVVDLPEAAGRADFTRITLSIGTDVGKNTSLNIGKYDGSERDILDDRFRFGDRNLMYTFSRICCDTVGWKFNDN